MTQEHKRRLPFGQEPRLLALRMLFAEIKNL